MLCPVSQDKASFVYTTETYKYMRSRNGGIPAALNRLGFRRATRE